MTIVFGVRTRHHYFCGLPEKIANRLARKCGRLPGGVQINPQ